MLLCLCLCSAAACFAAEPSGVPLRVTIFDIPPYGTRDAAREPAGLYVDITRAVAQQAGYEPAIELAPFARVLVNVSTGASDLTISFPTEGSTSSLLALVPIIKVDAIVVPRKGFVATDRRAFANRRVGRIRGGCIDLANAGDMTVEFFELNSFAEGLRLLTLGRIEGLCTTREVFRYYLDKNGSKAGDFGEPVVINRRDAWLFLRADAPLAMQQRLRDAVQELRRRKQLDAIIARYLGG
jgi:polar amino acid transport system substrate-binding protein